MLPHLAQAPQMWEYSLRALGPNEVTLGVPAAMLREATQLHRENRVPEAIRAYQGILAQWPQLAECWFNLALLQRQARRLDEALYSYQKALDAGVARPEEVHVNRAVIYSDYLNQPEAAERELAQALAINPAHTPALLNLANLKEDLGLRADALALYARILAQEPDCLEALARYANLQPPGVPDAALAAKLTAALAIPGASNAERASLGFALGRLLDAAGEYPAAFAAIQAANRASRASAEPHAASYDPERHHQFIDRLIALSTAAAGTAGGSSAHPLSPHLPPSTTPPPSALPQHRTATPPSLLPQASLKSFPYSTPQASGTPVSSGQSQTVPVFICGMFRSGSTLTEQLLSGFPGVAAGGELDFLPRLVDADLQPYPESLATLSAPRLAQFAAAYRAGLSRIASNAAMVLDKRPDNFLHIGLIKRLFPDARIVHTTRNPLDNCLSIFFLHLDQRMSYALDLKHIAHYYREYRRLMSHWRAQYPGDILDFDYDDLVRDPAPALERLCGFLGLDWQGQVPQVPSAGGTGRSVKTASVWQVREPLYRSSSGRARHYESELAELRDYLSDLPA
jgi:tetratricopeptide (TPR) repeat protein